MAASTKKTSTAARKKGSRSSVSKKASKNTTKTASKPSSAAVAAKGKQTGRLSSSRVAIVCLFVISFCLMILTIFRMGSAGALLYGLLSLFIGNFSIIFLIGWVVSLFWIIWKNGKTQLGPRFWSGFMLLAVGWCMAFALMTSTNQDPWLALATMNGQLTAILSGTVQTSYGWLGAILAGFAITLFSHTGAILVTASILFLSIVLIGWNILKKYWLTFTEDPSKVLKSVGSKNTEDSNQVLASGFPKPEQAEIYEPGSLFNRSILFDHGSKEPAVPDFELSDNGITLEKEPVKKKKTSEKSGLLLGKIGLDLPSSANKKQKKNDSGNDQSALARPGSISLDLPQKPSALPESVIIKSEETKAVLNEDSSEKKRKNKKTAGKETADNRTADSAGSQLPEFMPATSTDLADYRLPKLSLLNESPKRNRNNPNTIAAKASGARLIEILSQFGIEATLNEIHIGPSVTRFEITPGIGVRVSAITNLHNDIKMGLAATELRIEAPIPGKSAVGIEVPNVEKTEVSMVELMRNIPEKLRHLPLVFCLGKDLLGENVYGRLDTMPHLLIAGATGSGKSVCVNSIICSLLMKTRPDEVKLVLVDPKKVEFTPYNGVPHLLAPVITDGDLANKALKVVVEMMDRRYDLFEETGVRNIVGYNAYCDQHPDSHYRPLPRIVVIIDELADLMLAAAKEVEQSIQRITQLARAAGIHLIVATQRPSVNVITGVIKANIPSRIAFSVSSSVDSRTILDQVGAERLLGYGDMLFLDNGDTSSRRIQGVFIRDEEVSRIAEYVKSQAAPMYDDAFITLKDLQSQGQPLAPEESDPMYPEIKKFVIQSKKASTSLIQRRFSIGYARAARIMDALEVNGIIGPANGSKPREILVSYNYDEPDEFE